MVTRRSVLRAPFVRGLAGYGAAMAQRSPSAKDTPGTRKSDPGDPATVEAHPRVIEVLGPVRDAHRVPGLIGAVLAGDRVAALWAVGLRKVGSPEPFLVTDKIHLGSCGKAMTATVIGTLVDAGKLKWSSTLRDVFPEPSKEIHPDFRRVTLAHLLTHRAGLPNRIPWWTLTGRTETDERLSILTTMMKGPPRHRPGSRFEYSGVGYALAGLMAETVAHQPWEDLVKERLFRPLEMASAGFGATGRPGEVNQPWGHRVADGRVNPVQIATAPPLVPAGGVHCTISDWARFAALHLAAARGQPRLLEASTFRALQTPPVNFNYAGGWSIGQRSWAGGRTLSHGGTNTAWFATIWLGPAVNLGFPAATNQGDPAAGRAVDEAAAALIRACDSLLAG